MVAQTETQTADLTRATVIERVQQQIEAGKQPNAAFAAVYEQIEASGELEALARLHGVGLVGSLWRSWNIDHRPAAVSRTITQPVHPSSVTGTHDRLTPVDQVAPPMRVVDVGRLQATATMDSLYKIDGSWTRLGDLDSASCMKVFTQYRTAALADEHNARLFRALAQMLQDGETVEQKLTERELMRLFKNTKPVSRQIAGA